MTAPKLTKAQRDELERLGEYSYTERKPTVTAELEDMGLAESCGKAVFLTPAGRAALKDGAK